MPAGVLTKMPAGCFAAAGEGFKRQRGLPECAACVRLWRQRTGVYRLRTPVGDDRGRVAGSKSLSDSCLMEKSGPARLEHYRGKRNAQDGAIVAALVTEEEPVIPNVEPVDIPLVPPPAVMKAVWGRQTEPAAEDPVSAFPVAERVEDASAERVAQPGDMVTSIDRASGAALDGMLAMLAVRDGDAHAHTWRVSALAVEMAMILGVPDEVLAALEQAALLHDIGKVALPDAALRGSATCHGDQEAPRRCPEHGYELIRGRQPYLVGTADIVRFSCEWFNGSGYPNRLSGEVIPLGSRIVAVPDEFDELVRPAAFGPRRASRPARLPADAIVEIGRWAGTRFDPTVVDALRHTLAARE